MRRTCLPYEEVVQPQSAVVMCFHSNGSQTWRVENVTEALTLTVLVIHKDNAIIKTSTLSNMCMHVGRASD